MVTPTMPLHPAVLVTFKFTVKQVRLWLGTVLSSPRKSTHTSYRSSVQQTVPKHLFVYRPYYSKFTGGLLENSIKLKASNEPLSSTLASEHCGE